MKSLEALGLADMQARRDRVFGEWVKGHLDELISQRPFDETERHQAIEVVHIEPQPSLEIARSIGEASTGEAAHRKLVQDFQDKGVIEEMKARSSKGKSSLIALLHLDSAFDAAITHNALFVASGELEFADRNVVVANQLMNIMNIYGVSVPEVLIKSGHLVSGIPFDGAEKHGMDPDISEFVNRLVATELKILLEAGVVVHRALSGTRSKRVVLEDGTHARMVPRVSDQDAFMTKKRTPYVVGVPMLVKPGDSMATVLEPREITTKEEVHELMEEMADTASEMTGERIVYGLPEGAKIA